MHEAASFPLGAWEAFYVIVGSSAGALTGLQFVVMTLIAEHMPARDRRESISAFGTPNVVHFCAALLVAAILSAPWTAPRPVGIALAVCGALGVVYSVLVLKRAYRQSDYEPVFEDWLWHIALPAVAYGALLVVGVVLGRNSVGALFWRGRRHAATRVHRDPQRVGHCDVHHNTPRRSTAEPSGRGERRCPRYEHRSEAG